MSVNIRTKGQNGEREIAKALNKIVAQVRKENGYPALAPKDELFQRNQNQSAVGGDDLSNPLRLSIEVKRQEALSVNTWWKQCVASANRQDNIPVLLYRQNRKKWQCVILVDVPMNPPGQTSFKTVSGVRATIDFDSFLNWFSHYYKLWLN